jgi:hypothetical protein
LVGTLAVGAVIIVVAWLGANGTGRLDRQSASAATAVLGVGVVGVGIGGWVLPARRRIAARRKVILDAASTHLDGIRPALRVEGHGFVVLRGSTRYHRVGCQFIAGKRVSKRSREALARQGRSPCEVCQP